MSPPAKALGYNCSPALKPANSRGSQEFFILFWEVTFVSQEVFYLHAKKKIQKTKGKK
jgi:hypothetical protein